MFVFGCVYNSLDDHGVFVLGGPDDGRPAAVVLCLFVVVFVTHLTTTGCLCSEAQTTGVQPPSSCWFT